MTASPTLGESSAAGEGQEPAGAAERSWQPRCATPSPLPAPAAGAAARPAHAAAGPVRPRSGFGRQLGLTVLGAVLPGAGLLLAGRRRLGAAALALVVAAAVAVAVVVATGRTTALVGRLAVEPRLLVAAAVVSGTVGLAWCVLIVLTARASRPRSASRLQQVVVGLLVAVLCLAVALPGGVAARYALVQRGLVTTVFADQATLPARAGAATPGTSADPWRGTPRVNVLLIGGDAGADRTGLRADTLLVASIDTASGDMVLFSLPRNLENVPFPASDPLHRVYPNGYDCGSACLLNAVWEEARGRAYLFPGDRNPGLTATRDAVGEVLGLSIDYYGLLDLHGFQSVVNALGGVNVDVHRRIPIGGGENQQTGVALPVLGYIEPGFQHLDGYHALWFARSRQGSDDYDRIRRQRCLIGDLVDQVDPLTLVRAFPGLVASAKADISTDIPRQELPAWVQLASRIQNGRVTSLPFTSSVIDSASPDFPRIRRLVQRALVEQEPAKRAVDSTASPRPSSSSAGPAKAASLAEVC